MFGQGTSKEMIDDAILTRIPKKTHQTTQWAVSVFRSWSITREVKKPFEKLSDEELAELMPHFVMEARRQDKSPYPPNTLVQLVSGIQRHLRENGRPTISIFGEHSELFARTRNALDARMKQLTRDGVGIETKQAQPLSEEDEESLWSHGVFSVSEGWGFTYAIFWYNCKMFGLRGGDEYRSLVREQYEVSSDKHGRFLRFKGRNCKNVQGGLKQRKIQFKDLKIYARPDLGDRCAVALFVAYFGFVPDTGPLYRKPIGSNPPKYSKQVIGRNKLSGLVKEMCAKAGLSGNFANHSGKVTCATQLFAENIDEQLMMRQTGHRSTAVRSYKRPTAKHDDIVSSILQPPAPKSIKLPPPQSHSEMPLLPSCPEQPPLLSRLEQPPIQMHPERPPQMRPPLQQHLE